MTPKTLSQVNCQKAGILALLDGVKRCFERDQNTPIKRSLAKRFMNLKFVRN